VVSTAEPVGWTIGGELSPRRFHFHFAADTMREATDLARELRLRGKSNIVRVRPLPASARGKRRWAVAVETPPTSVTPETVLRLHEEMALVSRRGSSWQYLGWRAVSDRV
jgi:hypothetical protein